MLPSRNRVKAKRIQGAKPVAFSKTPVLNTSPQKIHSNGTELHEKRHKIQNTQIKTTAKAITTTVSPTAATVNASVGDNSLKYTKEKTIRSQFQTQQGERKRKAILDQDEVAAPSTSMGGDERRVGSSDQYTYVTDESGYTWLYDNTFGQYYYYDYAQGTYVAYNHGSTEGIIGGGAEAGTGPGIVIGTETGVDGSNGKEDSGSNKERRGKKRRIVRVAGGEVWEDQSLDEWPSNDYRLFIGDLGPEVTEEDLTNAFGKFRSFQKSRVVRDKRTGKSRGYGFLSFGNPDEFLAAWKEFNGKYVGSRPIKLRKSTWKDRNSDIRKVKRDERLHNAYLEYKQFKH